MIEATRYDHGPNEGFTQELSGFVIPGNTDAPTTTLDINKIPKELLRILNLYGCFHEGITLPNNNRLLRYNLVEANGCIYLVDPLKPKLRPGQDAVYQFHDEAGDLLQTARSLGMEFNMVIDAFRGGGHSTLPILKEGIALCGQSIDVNPRAASLDAVNALINRGFNRQVVSYVGDTKVAIPANVGRTLFVANPPFALATKGVQLELMRNGGENGLELTLAYLDKTLIVAQPGDVIIGVAYSRIGFDGKIEVEEAIKEKLNGLGEYEIELVKDATLWRGPNGKKEQPNPMPLGQMHTKTNDPAEKEAYNDAAKRHQEAGWEKLGYFRYIIRPGINKSLILATQSQIEAVMRSRAA